MDGHERHDAPGLARRSRNLLLVLLSLAIREWLSADDEMAEPGLVPVSETSST